jgi:hypothetical protein
MTAIRGCAWRTCCYPARPHLLCSSIDRRGSASSERRGRDACPRQGARSPCSPKWLSNAVRISLAMRLFSTSTASVLSCVDGTRFSSAPIRSAYAAVAALSTWPHAAGFAAARSVHPGPRAPCSAGLVIVVGRQSQPVQRGHLVAQDDQRSLLLHVPQPLYGRYRELTVPADTGGHVVPEVLLDLGCVTDA